MALSEIVKNIRDFYKINTERKALEKREDALKKFFREQAAGKEASFQDKARGLEVVINQEPRTTVDMTALRLKLGDEISKFEKTSTVEKVVVRNLKKEA